MQLLPELVQCTCPRHHHATAACLASQQPMLQVTLCAGLVSSMTLVHTLQVLKAHLFEFCNISTQSRYLCFRIKFVYADLHMILTWSSSQASPAEYASRRQVQWTCSCCLQTSLLLLLHAKDMCCKCWTWHATLCNFQCLCMCS